ncbi:ATP-binding protein [Sorangium sp. So ce1078]|uniref:ATP-binding protein n=1 Tax=Sorangium sp. So ce1078 TaxID=3133329 RepID=UPI003F63BD3F
MHRPDAPTLAQASAGMNTDAEPSAKLESEQIQLLLDALPALISYVDKDERYGTVNQAYERWFGEDRRSLAGRPVREIIGDAAYAAVKPRIDAVLLGKPQDFESLLVYRRGGKRHVRIQYIPHLGASGDVRGFFTLVSDIGEQKRAEEARRLLADATALLDPVLDRDTSYRRVAELAVTSVADWCSVHTLDPDGTLCARVIAHADPAKAELVSRLAQRSRIPPEPETPLHEVLHGGPGRLLSDIPDSLFTGVARDTEHLAALRALGCRSAVIVPIHGEECVLAALTLASAESGRAFTAADLAFAEELAQCIQVALQRMRLYDLARDAEAEARRRFLAEQEARRAAERAAQRMAGLQRITAALADALTCDAVAQVVVDQGVAAAGAYAGSIVVTAGDKLECLEAVGYEPAAIERFREMTAEDGLPLTDPLRTRAPVWLRSRKECSARYPDFAASALTATTASLCCLPLLVQERPIGVLGLSFAEPHPFDHEEQEFLVAMSRQCAQALERARLHEERAAIIERERRVALENARLYREAHEADRRKDEFIAMLSHELRNPLAPITTGLELLQMNTSERGDRDDSQILATLERQVKTIVRLVDDLLDVSRITRGKIELKRERLDVSSVVQTAVDSVRPLLAQRRHELILSVDPGIFVHGDRVRLEQIVVNLLNNAIKYTNPGGRVSLSCAESGGDAWIRVTDTGVGISAELLPRVFEPFMQARRTLDRSQGGLGVGLTLVKRLAELHGGRVEAVSAGPGEGTAISVWLPLAGASAESSAAPVTEIPRSGTSALRVLLVDDNVDAAEGLRRILQLHGHTVSMAHDGPAALETARASKPELVLLDIGLPGMDGYEVVRRLRAEPELRRSYIAAVSGYGQDQDRRRSREAGFDAHLTKPVATAQLLALVAEAAPRG